MCTGVRYKPTAKKQKDLKDGPLAGNLNGFVLMAAEKFYLFSNWKFPCRYSRTLNKRPP